MNYLAHGRHHLGEPYALAGTALPDWLRVWQRRARIQPEQAAAHLSSRDPVLAAVARGVLLHHAEDHRFHTRPVFQQSCADVTRRLRSAGDSPGFRPSVISHITIELLLDDCLEQSQPGSLARYYAALSDTDSARIEWAAGVLRGEPAPRLGRLIERFQEERFLEDYAIDRRLVARLDAVLARVRLPALPDYFLAQLPWIRALVSERRESLLIGPRPAPAPMPGP